MSEDISRKKKTGRPKGTISAARQGLIGHIYPGTYWLILEDRGRDEHGNLHLLGECQRCPAPERNRSVVQLNHLRRGASRYCTRCAAFLRQGQGLQVGERRGDWRAIEEGPRAQNGDRRWWMHCTLCEDDNRHLVRLANILNGNSQRCPKHRNELALAASITHGMSKSREFRIWSGILQRCRNPNCSIYKNYGKKGINVCDGLAATFQNFFDHLGPCGHPKDSINRINGTKGYTCGKCQDCKKHGWQDNVEWATQAEQCRNTKRNKLFTHDSETLVLTDWARKLGMKPDTVFARLRYGWSEAEALDLVPRQTGRTRTFTYDGVTMTIMEWARRLGLHPSTVYSRRRLGWPIEEALGLTPRHLQEIKESFYS